MATMPTTEQIVAAYYGEVPNKAAAVAAICLYAAVTVALMATTIRTRTWWMLAAVANGAIEITGYALRVQMLSAPAFMTYVVSYAFLVIGPVCLVIVEYICVGRLLARSEAAKDFIFAKWLTRFMSISEVACLGLQCAAGGPLTSKDDVQRNVGRQMMLAGLVMQIGFFTIFTAAAVYVQRSRTFGYRGNKQMTPLFYALYATIALFYMRNVFRVVEFAEGFDGKLAKNEEYFYIFDFAPIIAILTIFALFNYGFYLGSAPAEKKQQGKASDSKVLVVVESAPSGQ